MCEKLAEWEIAHGSSGDERTYSCIEHISDMLICGKVNTVFPAPDGMKCCNTLDEVRREAMLEEVKSTQRYCETITKHAVSDADFTAAYHRVMREFEMRIAELEKK